MNNRIYNAFNRLETKKQNKESLIPGLIGFMIGGVKTSEVQDRPGYVYVRLRNNTNELIIAFNDQVSPVYDLPVLVTRDEVDKTRYKIQGRDIGKYENWGSVSPYLPRHGNQHSFDPASGGGGDVVWVYDRQLMPLALVPSGTAGSGNVTIGHDTIFQRTTWKSVGGTGTVDLLAYKPTGTNARLVLVYLDQNGNPQTVLGSFFDASITGTAAIVPYLPYPPQTWDIPLGAVRLVSGTSAILWENIYDLRALIRDATTTGTSAFSGVPVYDDSVYKADAMLLDFTRNLDVAVTGTSVFVRTSDNYVFYDGSELLGTMYSLNSGGDHTIFYDLYGASGTIQTLSFRIWRSVTGGVGNVASLNLVSDPDEGTNGPSFSFDSIYSVNSVFRASANKFRIGPTLKVGGGIGIGITQAEDSSVIPATGTVMLRNVGTPASSPAGYTTIFSASGTPSAIDQNSNRYAMGRDFGASGSLSFVPLVAPLTSTLFDGDPFTTTPATLIDLSAVFGVPNKVKAVVVRIAARDSVAWGTGGNYFSVGPSSTYYYAVACYVFGGDVLNGITGICPCNENGDIYYRVIASATGTLDAYLEIWGYWV